MESNQMSPVGPTRVSAPDLSVVLPVYNEERALAEHLLPLYQALRRELEGRPFELLVADNGSVDGTRAETEKAARVVPGIHYIFDSRKGRGVALKQGFGRAKGKYLCVLSIDRAWGEDFISRALPLLDQGYDVVYGPKSHPQSKVKRPFKRTAASWVIRGGLALLFRVWPGDTQCIKAFRAEAAPFLDQLGPYNYFAETEFYLRARALNLRTVGIPVNVRDLRKESKTRFSSFIEFFSEALDFRQQRHA